MPAVEKMNRTSTHRRSSGSAVATVMRSSTIASLLAIRPQRVGRRYQAIDHAAVGELPQIVGLIRARNCMN